MTRLEDKVQNALDEARMLVLGTEVLIGFAFRAILEPRFAALSGEARFMKLIGIALLLGAVALLLATTTEHQVTHGGHDNWHLHRYVSRLTGAALVTLGGALTIDLHVATTPTLGSWGAILAGSLGLTAAGAWFGPRLLVRPSVAARETEMSTPLSTHIRHVLTEARVVLPGAQALFGFSLIAVLTDGFDKLPPASRSVHFVGLVCVTLAVIILMTPAAYHRLVEQGEETERFFRIARGLVLAALVPLSLALAAGFYVAAAAILGRPDRAAFLSALVLLVLLGMWFGLPLLRRSISPGPQERVSRDRGD